MERYRICAVCKRRHAATYGFASTLRRLGIEGDKAVPACVIRAMKADERKRSKQGEKIRREYDSTSNQNT